MDNTDSHNMGVIRGYLLALGAPKEILDALDELAPSGYVDPIRFVWNTSDTKILKDMYSTGAKPRDIAKRINICPDRVHAKLWNLKKKGEL